MFLARKRSSHEMRRLKRFILAENTEKDPIWKRSDNLMAGTSKMHEEVSKESAATPETSKESAALPDIEKQSSCNLT